MSPRIDFNVVWDYLWSLEIIFLDFVMELYLFLSKPRKWSVHRVLSCCNGHVFFAILRTKFRIGAFFVSFFLSHKDQSFQLVMWSVRWSVYRENLNRGLYGDQREMSGFVGVVVSDPWLQSQFTRVELRTLNSEVSSLSLSSSSYTLHGCNLDDGWYSSILVFVV